MGTRLYSAPTDWGNTCAFHGIEPCSILRQVPTRDWLGAQPNDRPQTTRTQVVTRLMEEQENKNNLTSELNVYTRTPCMGRPPKSENDRRSKLFPLRLTPGEMTDLES